MNDAGVDKAEAYLAMLTEEERKEVFSRFCTECGSYDPECQCWNDE